jgi:hypothetical protein
MCQKHTTFASRHATLRAELKDNPMLVRHLPLRLPLLMHSAVRILGSHRRRTTDLSAARPQRTLKCAAMLNWLRRRRLSADARRRLLIIAARSEEALIETHVSNTLDLLDALGEEIDLDRGIELYDEIMSLPPILAATVRTRVLARIETPTSASGRFRGVFGDDRAAKPSPRRKERGGREL